MPEFTKVSDNMPMWLKTKTIKLRREIKRGASVVAHICNPRTSKVKG